MGFILCYVCDRVNMLLNFLFLMKLVASDWIFPSFLLENRLYLLIRFLGGEGDVLQSFQLPFPKRVLFIILDCDGLVCLDFRTSDSISFRNLFPPPPPIKVLF